MLSLSMQKSLVSCYSILYCSLPRRRLVFVRRISVSRRERVALTIRRLDRSRVKFWGGKQKTTLARNLIFDLKDDHLHHDL